MNINLSQTSPVWKEINCHCTQAVKMKEEKEEFLFKTKAVNEMLAVGVVAAAAQQK